MSPLCSSLGKSYRHLISSGKYLNSTFIYSGCGMVVARKVSFQSRHINCTPFSALKIELFIRIFVSNSDVADDPVSFEYVSQLPPTTIRTCHRPDFSGLWSHIKDVYVMSLSLGTSIHGMKLIVFVARTSW